MTVLWQNVVLAAFLNVSMPIGKSIPWPESAVPSDRIPQIR